MLIITRKENDSLLIEVNGGTELIEIKINEISNNQVKLGMNAPSGCKIWRSEIYQTVQNNRQATKAALPDVKFTISALGDQSKKPLSTDSSIEKP